MYIKAQLEALYESFTDAINISEEMFEAAESEYQKLGRWLDENTPTYKLVIYPQGSFALGTVVKPFDDTDDYDLDLVCQFEKDYGISAYQLKVKVVKPLLIQYDELNGEIKEKRRCWHVEYKRVPQFHMDVIPAIGFNKYIHITNKDEDSGSYEYIGSNPAGYINWFNGRKEVMHKTLIEQKAGRMGLVYDQADIQPIVKEYFLRTPLQKAIQLLKRHRDIMFKDSDKHLVPISIIITTIAAQLYDNEDNIIDTLDSFLDKAADYIIKHRVQGQYHVDNPSYTGGRTENFADKWNEHPARLQAFLDWLKKARKDLYSDNLSSMNRVELGRHLKYVLGSETGTRVFNSLAEKERENIVNGAVKINASTGAISVTGTIGIPENHHHGSL